jgi:hypothetical protein
MPMKKSLEGTAALQLLMIMRVRTVSDLFAAALRQPALKSSYPKDFTTRQSPEALRSTMSGRRMPLRCCFHHGVNRHVPKTNDPRLQRMVEGVVPDNIAGEAGRTRDRYVWGFSPGGPASDIAGR